MQCTGTSVSRNRAVGKRVVEVVEELLGSKAFIGGFAKDGLAQASKSVSEIQTAH
jgi:hypothetical protein